MIRLTAVIALEGQAPRAITHESNSRSIIVGRDGSADLQLSLPTVSRRHARIVEMDNVYFLEDLGSTHGTALNGEKLEAGEKKMLRSGDIIELTNARITCAIQTEKVALADSGEGTQAIAQRAVQGILGRLGAAEGEGPFFRIVSGAGEGKRFPVAGQATEWTFGRSKVCEFVLEDPNVSRRHSLVKKDWNGLTIEDLGSKNGVIVNGKRIQKAKRLKDRDEIKIGPIGLIYIDPDSELLAALKDVPGFDLIDDAESQVGAEPNGEGPDGGDEHPPHDNSHGDGNGNEGDEGDGGNLDHAPPSAEIEQGSHFGSASEYAAELEPPIPNSNSNEMYGAIKPSPYPDEFSQLDPTLLEVPPTRPLFERFLFLFVSVLIFGSATLLYLILA